MRTLLEQLINVRNVIQESDASSKEFHYKVKGETLDELEALEVDTMRSDDDPDRDAFAKSLFSGIWTIDAARYALSSTGAVNNSLDILEHKIDEGKKHVKSFFGDHLELAKWELERNKKAFAGIKELSKRLQTFFKIPLQKW